MGPGEGQVAAARQQMGEPEHIGAVLSYVAGINVFAIRFAFGKIEKSVCFQGDKDRFVDKAYVVDDAPRFLERFEIVVIQKDGRKADHILFNRYRRKLGAVS